MTPQPTHRRQIAIGGTGFFLVVSIATIVTVALEAVFISVATWALLPLILLMLILMAIGVVAFALRLAEDGEIASVELPDPQPAPEPRSAPAPIGRPTLLGR